MAAADGLHVTGLQLRIHRVLLVVVVVVVVALVALAMVVLTSSGDHRGLELTAFATNNKTDAEWKKLTDRYNSYSGSLVSLATMALGVFLTMTSAVILLVLVTPLQIQPPTSSSPLAVTSSMVVVTVSAVVGYLLSNGLNALNVHVVPGGISMEITPLDLSINANVTVPVALDTTITWSRAYSENATKNSVYNTILRNNLLPPRHNTTLQCTKDGGSALLPAVGILIPPRPWQQRVLTEALETANVTIRLNKNGVEDLNRMADMKFDVQSMKTAVVYGVMALNATFGWWNQTTFPVDITAAQKRQPNGTMQLSAYFNLTSVDRSGLVKATRSLLTALFGGLEPEHVNINDDRANVQFHSVKIADGLFFDAMTVEVPSPFNPYANVISCTSNACICSDMLPPFKPSVDVLALCQEQDIPIRVGPAGSNPGIELHTTCTTAASDSFVVFSGGTRVEGNVMDVDPEYTRSFSVSNITRVYSFTAGRLSWKTDELNAKFGASCGVSTGCHGLALPLATGELLVVGNTSLPLDLLDMYHLSMELPFNRGVFSMNNPNQAKALVTFLRNGANNLLLPRNVKTMTPAATQSMRHQVGESCYVGDEKYVNDVELNHLYMEHSLQVAYTSAVHFLFQNGAVVSRSDKSASVLAFQGNRQSMIVVASIPSINAILTLVACGLLVVMAVAAFAMAKRAEQYVAEHATAHTIATAMLDSRVFPPTLVTLDGNVSKDDMTEETRPLETLSIRDMIVVSSATDGSDAQTDDATETPTNDYRQMLKQTSHDVMVVQL